MPPKFVTSGESSVENMPLVRRKAEDVFDKEQNTMKTDQSKTNFIALLFVLFLSFSPSVTAAAEGIASLKRLEGTWAGDGRFMGNAARLELRYEWVLNGKFLRLSLKNDSKTPAGERQVFEGHAYYELKSDNTISGAWFDSRGVSFALKGSFEGDALTVLWGNPGQEQGKSVYRLVDSGTLEVIDLVQLKDGTFRQFATAVVKRQ
jgi:hypothetical protein